jgi:hypothetical protein
MSKRQYADPEAAERRERIVAYLRERVERGDRYFRSKLIARDLGMTPRQVGANIVRIQDEVDDLRIEKNSRHTSICWRVERV